MLPPELDSCTGSNGIINRINRHNILKHLVCHGSSSADIVI